MFDTINGLPVHPLILHGVVVGVPLMALVTVVVAARASLRERFGWFVVLANAGLAALTLATAKAGGLLQLRLGGVAVEHGRLGSKMLYFVLAMLAASVVVALAKRRAALASVGLVLAVVSAAAAVWWVIRVGDAGAQAVWKNVIAATTKPAG